MKIIKTTRIFAYRGYVGVSAGDAFVNDPSAPGQLGCIVLIENVDISQEAYDLLQKVKRSRDSIGDVMCWGTTFAWMGQASRVIDVKKAEGDRDYAPELLKGRITPVEPVKQFIKAIDEHLKKA